MSSSKFTNAGITVEDLTHSHIKNAKVSIGSANGHHSSEVPLALRGNTANP